MTSRLGTALCGLIGQPTLKISQGGTGGDATVEVYDGGHLSRYAYGTDWGNITEDTAGEGTTMKIDALPISANLGGDLPMKTACNGSGKVHKEEAGWWMESDVHYTMQIPAAIASYFVDSYLQVRFSYRVTRHDWKGSKPLLDIDLSKLGQSTLKALRPEESTDGYWTYAGVIISSFIPEVRSPRIVFNLNYTHDISSDAFDATGVAYEGHEIELHVGFYQMSLSIVDWLWPSSVANVVVEEVEEQPWANLPCLYKQGSGVCQCSTPSSWTTESSNESMEVVPYCLGED